MKADIEYITDILKADDPNISLKPGVSARITSSSELNSKEAYNGYTLYITKSSEMPETLNPNVKSIICYEEAGHPITMPTDSSLNLIVTKIEIPNEKIQDAVSLVIQANNRFLSASEEIVDALYNGRGLQAIVDYGQKVLGNPITIMDTGLKILAHSKSYEPENSALKDSFRYGVLSEVSFEASKTHKRLEKMSESREPVFTKSFNVDGNYKVPEPEYGWYDSAVRVKGVVVAYMAVGGFNHAFDFFTKEWINYLAKLASIELQKDEFIVNNLDVTYESLMLDLLKEKISDQLLIKLRLRTLNIELREDLYVITIQVHQNDSEVPSVGHAKIREFFPQSISVNYKGNIVLLASKPSGVPLLPGKGKAFLYFLKSNQLKAGISNVFSQPSKMRRYYQQTIKALNFGGQLKPADTINYYYQYSIFHALEICSENMSLRDLCHPGIKQLNESGDAGDRELLQTLYLYLSYMKDASKVSEELHIHRNTLFYRLNKMKAKAEVSIDDTDSMFNVLLSFKLFEYFALFQANEEFFVAFKHRSQPDAEDS